MATRRRECSLFQYIRSSLQQQRCGLKINSNINIVYADFLSNKDVYRLYIYNINNNKTRKVSFWEFHMLYYLSVSQKQWTIPYTPKLVIVTEK